MEGRAGFVGGAASRSGQAAPEPARDRAGGWPASRGHRAEPCRGEGRRPGPRRRPARRAECPAGADLAARARTPAGYLRQGAMGRRPGRLEATAGRLRRGRVVAARPVRGRHSGTGAHRRGPGGDCALVARRTPPGEQPRLVELRRQGRLSQRQLAADRRGRRDGRSSARQPRRPGGAGLEAASDAGARRPGGHRAADERPRLCGPSRPSHGARRGFRHGAAALAPGSHADPALVVIGRQAPAERLPARPSPPAHLTIGRSAPRASGPARTESRPSKRGATRGRRITASCFSGEPTSRTSSPSSCSWDPVGSGAWLGRRTGVGSWSAGATPTSGSSCARATAGCGPSGTSPGSSIPARAASHPSRASAVGGARADRLAGGPAHPGHPWWCSRTRATSAAFRGP